MEKGINPLDMFDHPFAELPAALAAQREELERELKEKTRGLG